MNEELEKPGDNNRDWYGYPWKIDLAENFPISYKCITGQRQTCGKVTPNYCSGHIEKERGYAIGRNFSQPAEDDGENERINQGLDNVPQRSQNSLLVEGDKITLHKHIN